MSLTKDDVKKVAHLARLAIEENEIEKYTSELSTTMNLIATLENINTDGITAMAHPLDCAQRLRADDVSTLNEREKFQKLAPSVEAGLYLVPKVLD